MALTGVLFSLSGIDVYSGESRFTFGLLELSEGVNFAVVAVGLFGFAEIVRTLEVREEDRSVTSNVSSLMVTWREFRSVFGAIVRGTGIGSFFGILPGTGPSISAYVAYIVEKRVNPDRANFGKGSLAGVASPESANNAAAQTSFIPTLTLGIPGGATMALMLGALMIQGIAPGPQILVEQAPLFWGLVASMWIGNLMLVVLNLPLISVWVKLLKTPYRWLYPSIIVFACVGVFTVNGSTLDVMLAALFATLGYLFLKLELDLAPFILGFVLGPLLEENFRRAMIVSRGDPMIFLERPISLTFLTITVMLMAMMIFPAVRRGKEAAVAD
jgi:TctA family transporter